MRKPIDKGKAQALRNAGWKIKDIADEMKCCYSAVYNNTTPPPPKKKYAFEFSDREQTALNYYGSQTYV